jgi:hypothetical protein
MFGLLMVAVFVVWHESLIIVLRNKLMVFVTAYLQNLQVRLFGRSGGLGVVGTAVLTGVVCTFSVRCVDVVRIELKSRERLSAL